jgi:hypothetical protein
VSVLHTANSPFTLLAGKVIHSNRITHYQKYLPAAHCQAKRRELEAVEISFIPSFCLFVWCDNSLRRG